MIEAWLSDLKLVVTVGSGGVGKTTTAAAIALQAALMGRRVMVLTIDPAKRLANSLGLEAMGGEPTRIDLSSLGVQTDGELWGAMLDSKGTFDRLIRSVAPDSRTMQRILDNHVYRQMADALAGSQDYMATEQLHDLAHSDRFDLIVLDTPPVKNALDFLESPGRMVEFLDERILGWFLKPNEGGGGRLGGRWIRSASNLVYRMLDPIFGREFLEDLSVFLRDFQVLLDGFRTRHGEVLDLLQGEHTAFVVITSPSVTGTEVASYFLDELKVRRLPLKGLIINQLHEVGELVDDGSVIGELARHGAEDPELARWFIQSQDHLWNLVLKETALVEPLEGRVTDGMVARLPRLVGEVNDLPTLKVLGDYWLERAEPAGG